MPQYLLKCVKDKMYDFPEKELFLKDIRKVVENDPDLVWGNEPGERLVVRNSDGSSTTLDPKEGFLMKQAGNLFVVCYEHYQGIAIHAPENQELVDKCLALARILNAKIFQIS